ncbi:diaminopimelate epimerase [Algivirga pacifica]|uniref:Diaminopimelate epimerase n=1 Tax=Algivirga pacifica TaxID=1162670 RepID=A0ABP9DJT5_9BACT
MKSITFYKYQGTGNDFVVIDDRKETFDIEDYHLVHRLCDRRFGVGADGLILIRNHEAYDFEMVYFNADGHVGSMCGNGGRCAVQFAKFLDIFDKQTTFWAADGLHEAFIEDELVHLKMNAPKEIEEGDDYFFMDTGSPHYVSFKDDIGQYNMYAEGRKIRYNDRFKEEGTNVNFVERRADGLKVRTYERGVEDETFSCGTGVTACVIAAGLQGAESPVAVEVEGGDLMVSFDKKDDNSFDNVYLIGPAVQVFEGKINV